METNENNLNNLKDKYTISVLIENCCNIATKLFDCCSLIETFSTIKKEDFLESLKTDLDNQHNEETEKIYYREEESKRIKDIINTNTKRDEFKYITNDKNEDDYLNEDYLIEILNDSIENIRDIINYFYNLLQALRVRFEILREITREENIKEKYIKEISTIAHSVLYYQKYYQDYLLKLMDSPYIGESYHADRKEFPIKYIEKLTEHENSETLIKEDIKHVEEYKTEFYNTLNSRYPENSYLRIKEYIEEVESTRIDNIVKSHYYYYNYLLKNCNTKDFLNILSYLRIDSHYNYFNNRFAYIDHQQTNQINASIIEININNLTLFFYEKYHPTGEEVLKYKELAISILVRIHNEIKIKADIDKKIELFKDLANIKKCEHDLKKVTLDTGYGEKIHLTSEFFTKQISFSLKRSLNSSIYDTINIDEYIEKLEYYKKKHPYIIVRKIAEELIDFNIMDEISLKGNKYKLYNSYNQPISLRRKDAELIYDIANILGFEIKKIKGKDKNKHVLYYDKMDVIKERLETSANIETEMILDIINTPIDLLL